MRREGECVQVRGGGGGVCAGEEGGVEIHDCTCMCEGGRGEIRGVVCGGELEMIWEGRNV